jgi:hypothetical protein
MIPKLNFIQDYFNPGGDISAPIVMGTFICFTGLFMALMTPFGLFQDIYGNILLTGLSALGLGSAEVGISKFSKKLNPKAPE